MNIKINIFENSLRSSTLKEIDKKFKPILKFWYTLYLIGFLGLLFSIPCLIWFGWSIFWRELITSIIIYFPTNFMYRGIIMAKDILITKLKEKNMLIDEIKK